MPLGQAGLGPVQMDDLQGGGRLARAIVATNGDTSQLRNDTTLREDDWERIDERVVTVATKRLVGSQDLIARGLITPIDGMRFTHARYERVSRLNEAVMSMDGQVRSPADRLVFEPDGTPLPITHIDYNINLRALEESRNGNTPLDTTSHGIAADEVSRKVEKTLFNGAGGYMYGGYAVYGYTDFPQRVTMGFGVGPWSAAARTGEEILLDVLALLQGAIDSNKFGPYGIYYSRNASTKMAEDFKANSDKSIRERIMETPELQFFKAADYLADDNVVLVNLDQDTVEMIVGLQVTPFEWTDGPGFQLNFKQAAILVPRLKSDYLGQSGVVHMS